MKLSEISIRRPVLATVMSLAIILFGSSPTPGCRSGSTRHRSPHRVGQHLLSRGQPQRGGDRDHGCPRGAVRHPRGGQDHDLLQPGAGIGHHHRVRALAGRRRGVQRRQGSHLPGQGQPPPRGRRSDREQGGRQRPTHFLAGALQRPPQRPGAVVDRRRPEGADPEAPRGGVGLHRGGAALRHEGLAGPGPAGGPRPDPR